MTHKSLILAAALGLCSVTLAGCVSEGGSYETRGPSVYRERVFVEPRDDFRRRTPDYDSRDARYRDRRERDRDFRRDDDRSDYRDRDRRRCIAPNCIDPDDDNSLQYDRRNRRSDDRG